MKIVHMGVFTLLFSSLVSLSSWTQAANTNVDLDIKVESEKKEVGLKRLALIEKLLSNEMIANKRALVANIESDYNAKISNILKTIISSAIEPQVSTHINVNFFAADFDDQVHASQKVATTIIISQSVFGNWQQQHNNDRAQAVASLKDVISSSFSIPKNKVVVLVLN